jgi:hypothetical protein
MKIMCSRGIAQWGEVVKATDQHWVNLFESRSKNYMPTLCPRNLVHKRALPLGREAYRSTEIYANSSQSRQSSHDDCRARRIVLLRLRKRGIEFVVHRDFDPALLVRIEFRPSEFGQTALESSANAATARWNSLDVSFCACDAGRPLISCEAPRIMPSSVPW